MKLQTGDLILYRDGSSRHIIGLIQEGNVAPVYQNGVGTHRVKWMNGTEDMSQFVGQTQVCADWRFVLLGSLCPAVTEDEVKKL